MKRRRPVTLYRPNVSFEAALWDNAGLSLAFPASAPSDHRPEFPCGLAAIVDTSPDKIPSAVETCLALAVGNSDPFTRVAAYLASLSDNRDWRDAEVIEVQVRVIRALMKRIAADKKPSATAPTL
jgi:hypothetical protein